MSNSNPPKSSGKGRAKAPAKNYPAAPPPPADSELCMITNAPIPQKAFLKNFGSFFSQYLKILVAKVQNSTRETPWKHSWSVPETFLKHSWILWLSVGFLLEFPKSFSMKILKICWAYAECTLDFQLARPPLLVSVSVIFVQKLQFGGFGFLVLMLFVF